jgi:muramoyltetrapeptide carboxypeptidase LdcA involved in peptidoglycan recycling
VQGEDEDVVEGPLVGGCMEVLEMLKGTPWWPPPSVWDGAVLYFETSEVAPDVAQVEEWLRNYASQGILQKAAGMLVGRPMRYSLEKKLKLFAAIQKVMVECDRSDLPVVADMDFGHTGPVGVLPNGCHIRIDPQRHVVTLPESAVW